MLSFLEIRFIDIVDVVLVAYILYMIYKLVKGTIAFNIILSIIGFVVFWLIVRALKMNMLTGIMNSFVSIGLLALIIIFQQEVRRFLVVIGTRYDFIRKIGLNTVSKEAEHTFVNSIVKACDNMSRSKTGALIVIVRTIGLKEYISTGTEINAKPSASLIETIFFKNTPLHDGAMIADKRSIFAAACILPISHSMDIPKSFGLRHRSALGITEASDAIAIVVSEETGKISIFDQGTYIHVKTSNELGEFLEKL